MHLIIRDNKEEASAYVANLIIQRIKEFAPTRTRPFVLGLPTGSTPLGVYRILVQKYKAGEISFENVVTFNMDEYVGLPRDHPESYHSYMWRHFFSHVNIHPSNAHILDGNAPDLDAECAAYEAEIEAAGGIDLFLAGMGQDGHIAFNEPGSSLASRTRPVTLAPDTISANSRFFGDDPDKVPRKALTVGVKTVLDAREVVAIVLGPSKALALHHCVEKGVSHMGTLSALQLHPCARIVCDEDATLSLKVGTVKYFKGIEQDAPTPAHRAPVVHVPSRTPSPVFDSMRSRLAEPTPIPAKTRWASGLTNGLTNGHTNGHSIRVSQYLYAHGGENGF